MFNPQPQDMETHDKFGSGRIWNCPREGGVEITITLGNLKEVIDFEARAGQLIARIWI
jgi:hypothetical protein